MDRRNVRTRFGAESGQAVLATVALLITVLFGFAGFATDVGLLFRQKRLLQTAADSAALAGAMQVPYSGSSWAPDVSGAAQTDAGKNGLASSTVTVNNPPSSGPNAGRSGFVEVVISKSFPTIFMRFFHSAPVTVSARAVAVSGSAHGCIVALGSSGQGFLGSGNMNLIANQCGISVNSSSAGAMSVNGNVGITANSIAVTGTYSSSGNVSVSPTPSVQVAPASDPLGYLTPPTQGPCVTYSGATTISAGNYCSGIGLSGNKNITLSGGTYLFGGDFSVSGNVTINSTGGVTLYFYNGSTISLTGNGAVTLTAPTSGAYAGVLFYQDRGDSSTMTFKGNTGGTLTGAIYAPDAQLSFVGNSSATFNTALVAESVSFKGNVTINDLATVTGSSPLHAVSLVE